jgi:GDP-4-dehydro-6-deoxy-D-mannose reductase
VRIVVTGAAGFVGSRLVARLTAEGAAITSADRELDVTDAPRIESALRDARPEAIVHLAAISSVPEAEANRALAFRVNYLGTRSVLAGALRAAPRARVLLASTCTVYGSAPPGSAPFDEGAPLRPHGAYARSKAASDLLGAAYAARGLDVVRARPWNHTGAGRPDSFVESSLARQIVAIEAGRSPPRLAVGNLDSVRDFLHVEDVIDAYLALLQPAVPAGVYNIASGEGLSIRALLDGLLALASARPEVVVDPARLRPADVTVGAAEKLRAATGWRPARGAEQAFLELMAFWRKRLVAED